jgi:N-acetylneuraminate lyase
MNKITGFIAAPFTPMDGMGNICYSTIPEYAKRLKASGVKGVFVGGTTGEGYSLSCKERMLQAETWIKSQDQDFKVIVHCGSEIIAQALAMAEQAKEIEAYAVGIMSPVFFKPDYPTLLSYCEKVAQICHPLPFYYYHIPSMTGAHHTMVNFLIDASKRIPNFAGIKYTHEDLMEYSLLVEYENGKYDILFGRDEILSGGLAMGAKGMIGSTYNYAMGVYNPLLSAFNRGDGSYVKEWQIKSQKIVEVLKLNGGGIVAGKAMMKLAGLDLGPCRMPNGEISLDQLKKIENELQERNVRQFIKI